MSSIASSESPENDILDIGLYPPLSESPKYTKALIIKGIFIKKMAEAHYETSKSIELKLLKKMPFLLMKYEIFSSLPVSLF